MMVAVAAKLEKKMQVTDRVAKDAACLSNKAMACSSKAMAMVVTVAENEATTKTEVEELRKRQEVLECKQETIDGMKEELENLAEFRHTLKLFFPGGGGSAASRPQTSPQSRLPAGPKIWKIIDLL